MAKRKKFKKGYLPPAFYSWLQHLEAVEARVEGRRGFPNPTYHFNNDLFPKIMWDENLVIQDLIRVEAWLASQVRSSMKYVLDLHTVHALDAYYGKELAYVYNTTPMRMPYENCTLILTNIGRDDLVLNLSEVEPTRYSGTSPGYKELGIEAGEKFISVSMAAYRARGGPLDSDANVTSRLSTLPVEIHIAQNRLPADTRMINAMPRGMDTSGEPSKRLNDLVDTVQCLVTFWMQSFHLQSVLRSKQVGISHMAPPKELKKRRTRRWQRPLYEHYIIHANVDEPEPSQTGAGKLQPKKRLHSVRGFWRHYKQPIKRGPHKGKMQVWVESHWRGNPELGVIKKDYELGVGVLDES